jgi:uncharacterized membrane protein YfcA
MSIPFDLQTYVIAAVGVGAAYVIFGITAFGAALFTVPLLSQFFALEFVLPMSVLLDVSAALALRTRFSREADKSELKLMVPACFIGAVLGVTLLVNLPRAATMAALGAFLMAYGGYALHRGGNVTIVGRGWAPVSGLAGGVLGTLFGIGAPPYAIYLSRRKTEVRAYRATLSNMVLFSVSIRALVFLASGLMLADRVIGFAMLVPFALTGLWYGNHLQRRISRETTLRLVSAMLLLIGASLIYRTLA